jgi:hypothetical protein
MVSLGLNVLILLLIFVTNLHAQQMLRSQKIGGSTQLKSSSQKKIKNRSVASGFSLTDVTTGHDLLRFDDTENDHHNHHRRLKERKGMRI